MLEKLLVGFSSGYDIEREKRIADRTVTAYAELRAINQKYILDKKHVLWTAKAFEHIAFVPVETLTAETVADWFTFMTKTAEAPLIHPDAKLPEEGHMVSYLTVIFLCDKIDPSAAQAVKKAKFTKNYLFSIRGWATGRVLAMDGSGTVVANRDGREHEKLLKNLTATEA
ncbi:MAG: hypothetical protein MJ099_06130 [Clostridia bacterium]|nr:hypothetical protein [Clostridia bacterium]